MPNPMLSQLNKSRMAPMINMLKNPLNHLPQYKQVMNYINANGGDPEAAFYKMAREMGIDPEDVLSQLR